MPTMERKMNLETLNPAETLLELSEIVLPLKTNETPGLGVSKIIEFKNKKEKAVFKPQSGEAVSMKVSPDKVGSYFKYERAAYIVDKAIGIGLIPPTVIRTVDGECGSSQLFIRNVVSGKEFEKCANRLADEQARKQISEMVVLDYILWSADRNEKNYLVDTQTGNLYAIDNGLSFGHEKYPDSDTYPESFLEQSWYDMQVRPIVWSEKRFKDIREKLLQFGEAERMELRLALEEWIDPAEAEAAVNRIEYITEVLKKDHKIDPQSFLPYDPHRVKDVRAA